MNIKPGNLHTHRKKLEPRLHALQLPKAPEVEQAAAAADAAAKAAAERAARLADVAALRVMLGGPCENMSSVPRCYYHEQAPYSARFVD